MHPKLEVVRIRQQYKNQEKLNIAGGEISTTPAIVKSMKTDIVKSDFEVLLSPAAIHPSAKYVATVAETTSWCRMWDIALDRGVQGTRGMQSLLVVKSLKTFHVDPVVISLSKDSNREVKNHPLLESKHTSSTLQVCQRGGWALFQVRVSTCNHEKVPMSCFNRLNTFGHKTVRYNGASGVKSVKSEKRSLECYAYELRVIDFIEGYHKVA